MSSGLFLDTAKRLALQASAEIKRLRSEPLQQARREDKSLVTVADLRSDEIIRQGLENAFPDHVVLSEETGLGDKKDAEYVWLVDPLDGTKAYAKGIAGFAVMVGLLKRGEPCLGVVVDPVEDRIYEAVRGEGAFLTEGMQRIALHVSERHQFQDMPLIISTGFPEETLALIRHTLNGPIVSPINSVGIKVGLLVRQEGDIYINHHPVHLWDTCAPQIILEEAGGIMTRLDGAPLSYELKPPFSHNSRTLATNGQHHEDIVTYLASVFAT